MSTFGELLTGHRTRAKLAQNRLARISKVNVGTINRLEHGQRQPTSRAQVLALASALELDVHDTNPPSPGLLPPWLASANTRQQSRRPSGVEGRMGCALANGDRAHIA